MTRAVSKEADAVLAEAIEHHRGGRWPAAADGYRRALGAGLAATGALLEAMAAACWQAERRSEAETRLRQALAMSPDGAMCHRNLGVAAADSGDAGRAVIRHRRAAACKPDNPMIWSAVASAHRDLGDTPSAVVGWRRALILAPSEAATLFDLGVAHQDADRWADAAALYRRSIASDPTRAAVHGNLGVCLSELNRTPDALRAFEAAVGLEPDVFRRRHALHLERLKAGRFADAWAAITDAEAPTLVDITGRSVLLFDTAGFGDVIQFMRYAPMVRDVAREVRLEVPPPLLGLARRMIGADHVVAAGQSRPVHDVALRLLDLPRLFGTTEATIPGRAPYLSADPAAVRAWAPRLHRDRRLVVGFAWAGDPAYPLNRLRSPGLGALLPLLDSDVARFYALQVGAGRDELAHRSIPAAAVDLGNDIDDFDDTAAIVAGLDLVITPCTALAHLAGALGKPTWVMLRHASDWRWMLGREDSPWYPTLRLFRQPAPGDWRAVVARLRDALPEANPHGPARSR